MPPRLKHIEVENFKSFQGRKIIGPLSPFSAVMGPNGSGKSNFMDAISFVMGERIQSLRVKRLNDLIHGAVIRKPIARSASVKAVFTLDEESGEEISFQRSIQGSSSEYRINDAVVSNNEYLAELAKIRVNVKGKNFLVFQGAVESIAMKNPKEMTAMFEEIGGSGALRSEYDRLKHEMEKTKEETNFAYKKKKGIDSERRGARLEKEEADKYELIKKDLNGKLAEYQLFRLYYNESELKDLENDLKHKQDEAAKVAKKKEKAEEVLKDKKKKQGVLNRELAKLEQDIREAEVEVYKKRPQFIKTKERVSHTQKKLDSAVKTLEQARKAYKKHMNEIAKLEKELADVEKAKGEYESQISEESQSQGRDVHLEDEQVAEYHRLKEEAAKRSARYMQELDSANREQKSNQDELDNLTRMKTDMENKHRQKCREREEVEKRIEKLTEHIRLSEEALHEQKQVKAGFQSDVVSSRNRIPEIQKQLEDVLEALGDATTDKYEGVRRKNQQEIVERFKSHFPGVRDRMINLCQPVDKKYNVAVTKVLGKFMDAIVVDTEQTARRCIQYLKEQTLGIETFLPLGYLTVPPIKDSLRKITEPRGVQLVYDVIQFEPQTIEKAVLFVTRNAVVCETPEDAMKVAYDLGGRNDAIALDGTYYHKSGIISGGSLDLAKKAKRWNEKHISQLKAQREKLTEELRDAMKKSRIESDLNTIDLQVKGSEIRLGYAKNDMRNTMNQIKSVHDELVKLSREIQKYGPKTEEIATTMATRKEQIEEIKLQMNSVEDVIFSKFCAEIGLRDIRQYEDRELLAHEERKQKRLELQMQINRLTSILEFERGRDTKDNVCRWERTVKQDQESLETCKKQEQRQRENIGKDQDEVKGLKDQRVKKKQEVDGMDADVQRAGREVKCVAKEAQAAQKMLGSLVAQIEGNKTERHAILMKCRMDDITIPMTDGHIEDIAASDPSQRSSEDTRSTDQNEKETAIKIDYSTLSNLLTDIDDKDEINTMADNLLQSVQRLQDILGKIRTPNMRALQKLHTAQDKLKSANEEFEKTRKRNKKISDDFEKIKKRRLQTFTTCFDHVSKEIDSIYKSLTQNPAAQAFLGTENPEEPYLGGIDYNCVAPGKRFQAMTNLSGGEKTIAALALLFAIHSYQPAPFFVLDEVDAALDNTNVVRLAKYIREKTESLQTIVISLKEEFSAHADLLIGIYPQPGECLISQVATVDLTKYPN